MLRHQVCYGFGLEEMAIVVKPVSLFAMLVMFSWAQNPKESCSRENLVIEERYDCHYNPKTCDGGSLCVVIHVECDRVSGVVCRQYKREFCVE